MTDVFKPGDYVGICPNCGCPIQLDMGGFEKGTGILVCKKCLDKSNESTITENILQEAQRITHSDRNKDYDDPIRNYEHIAKIASAILKKEITPQDVVIIMIATKLSRENFKHKRDNCTDGAGYFWILSYLNGENF